MQTFTYLDTDQVLNGGVETMESKPADLLENIKNRNLVPDAFKTSSIK